MNRLKFLLDLLKGTTTNIGRAPKTNLSKVRSRVEADKKNIKELSDSGQIPTKGVSRRDFLKGTGAVIGTGIMAAGSKIRPAVKFGKDLDINFVKNTDAEQDLDGAYSYSSNLTAYLKPFSEKAEKMLKKLSGEGKVKEVGDGDYIIEVDDIDDSSLSALEEISGGGLKYDVNKLDFDVNPETNELQEVYQKIDNLRSPAGDNPFFYQTDYGPDLYESEAAEYAVDILQPKTVKEQINERLKNVKKGMAQGGIVAITQ